MTDPKTEPLCPLLHGEHVDYVCTREECHVGPCDWFLPPDSELLMTPEQYDALARIRGY